MKLHNFYLPLLLLAVLNMFNGCGPMPDFSIKKPAPDPNVKNSTNSNPQEPQLPTIPAAAYQPDHLTAVQLSGVGAKTLRGDIDLSGAKNEWISFVVQVKPKPSDRYLILPQFNLTDLRTGDWRAYQVLPMPVDMNRAGFVRHTGLDASVESLPRALLPLAIEKGTIDLNQLRDPKNPADNASKALATNQPVLIWIDLHLPANCKAGNIASAVSISSKIDLAESSIPMRLKIEDFAIPNERKLALVAELKWDTLIRHWQDRFEVIRPNLLSRNDKKQARAVETLDQIMLLAAEHRAQVYIPRLQPLVKWPSGQPPVIDWTMFDSILTPWITGQAFPDRIGVTYWPIPKIDYLDNYLVAPRIEYYTAAASHFDQLDWLSHAPIVINRNATGPTRLEERIILSSEARRIMDAYPRVRVSVPLELDEIQIADSRNDKLIDPTATARLNCIAPGLISSSPLRKWPKELSEPQSWVRTDLRGLIPYVGAGGDESDVRSWAFMAFIRKAKMVQWDECLPTTNSLLEPGNPNELTWFVPGEWFGVDGVLPTVQLKWLRRAEQDFEYLSIAYERGASLNIRPMARALTKPVEIDPGKSADPTYGMLIGTADSQAWIDARTLIAKAITLNPPGQPRDENAIKELDLQTYHWITQIEKPVIFPRTTTWSAADPQAGGIGVWTNLKLDLDIYNASDTTPDRNDLRYAEMPTGWNVKPQAESIPKLTVYQVQRYPMLAHIDPAIVSPSTHKPVKIVFTNGDNNLTTPVSVVVPVTRSYRRLDPVRVNGSLEEWVADDAIQMGPLVKMFSRPAMQRHELEYSPTPTSIYSGWSDNNLFFAFRLEGLAAPKEVSASRNFVEYQIERAWGEDVAQVIIQAFYEDGTSGPALHLALKPSGTVWTERNQDQRLNPKSWETFDAGLRYAPTVEKSIWRGELEIPWRSLIAPEKTQELARQGKPNIPTMLRFNFIQHKRDTGESASWAGPIDQGKNDNFTGVIVLKEPEMTAAPQPVKR